MSFIVSCESTVDMPYEYVSSRNLPVIFYKYEVDGKEYKDDMGDSEGMKISYDFINAGKIPTTSQINEYSYREFFEEQLKKGDLLHLALGTGMTKSVNNAFRAAEDLKEDYPDRKIIVIDTTCSSSGYGLIVDYAADLRDEGKSIDEIAAWVESHKRNIHHQFFSTDLKYYRRTGRMSGPTAAVAAVLDICPIMRLDIDGKIIAYSKVRGKKAAMKETVNQMLLHAEGGKDYSGKCFICHSAMQADAEELKRLVTDAFPRVPEVRIFNIGAIIRSHCGPGTAAVFFVGDRRQS